MRRRSRELTRSYLRPPARARVGAAGPRGSARMWKPDDEHAPPRWKRTAANLQRLRRPPVDLRQNAKPQ
eukprot:3264009-Pleurochrysis_carterae.AAC.2